MACPFKEIPHGLRAKMFRPLDPEFYYNLAIHTTYFNAPSYHEAIKNYKKRGSSKDFYNHYVESGHKIYTHLYLDRFFRFLTSMHKYDVKKHEGHELLYEVYVYGKHVLNVYFDDEDFMTKFIKVTPIAILNIGLKFEKYSHYILIEELQDYITNEKYKEM